MDLHEAEACVRLVTIFQQLADADVSAIATLVHDREVAVGEMLYTEGTMADQLLIVAHGQVKITKSVASGREQLLRVLQPGDFDGEASLFTAVDHTTAATALTPTQLCTINQTDFQQLLQATPQLAMNVMNALGQRVGQLEDHLTGATVLNVTERLANYLVDTSAAMQSKSFDLPLMKKDLALYLGTTPETISRRLADFSQQGLIELQGRKHVIILDTDRLMMVE